MEGKTGKENLPEGIIGIIMIYSLLNAVSSLIPFGIFELALLVDLVFRPAGGISLMIIALIIMRNRVSRTKGLLAWLIMTASFLTPWIGLFFIIGNDPLAEMAAFMMGITFLGLVLGTDILVGLPNRYRIASYLLAILYGITFTQNIRGYFIDESSLVTPFYYYTKQLLQILFWGGLGYLLWKDKIFVFSLEGAKEAESLSEEDLLFPEMHEKNSRG